jgi:hypothetical protein
MDKHPLISHSRTRHRKGVFAAPCLRHCIERCLGLCLGACLLSSTRAQSVPSDWSIGVYGGRYYDTEPAGFSQGNANYQDQYLLALTATKTLWRSPTLPLSLELDGMLGQQWGLANLQEVAVAPVLRWSRFPWNDTIQTDLRLGPLGVSYTTAVGPLERNSTGQGSQWLNFLMIELAFSRPQQPAEEVFVRLHHRCAIYDLVNNYGANGEDFLAFGYRHRF